MNSSQSEHTYVTSVQSEKRQRYQNPRNPHESPCSLKPVPWGTALLIPNTMDQFCIFKNFIKMESYVIDSLLFGFLQSALCL